MWSGACSNWQDFFNWTGNNYTVTGGVHSNGYLNIPSSNIEITGGESTVVEYATEIGSRIIFDPPLEESTGTPLSNPFETEYTFSRFDTGGDICAAAAVVNRIVLTDQPINLAFLRDSYIIAGVPCYNEGTKTLQDGIYVTTSTSGFSFDINESNIHGDGGTDDFANITVASMGGIRLSGNSNKFKPYIGNFEAAGSTSFLRNLHGIFVATWWDRGGGESQCKQYVISTSGNGHQFQSFFYAPYGQVSLNGQPEHTLGCVIGYTVLLNGNGSSITCDDTWFLDSNWSIGIVQ